MLVEGRTSPTEVNSKAASGPGRSQVSMTLSRNRLVESGEPKLAFAPETNKRG